MPAAVASASTAGGSARASPGASAPVAASAPAPAAAAAAAADTAATGTAAAAVRSPQQPTVGASEPRAKVIEYNFFSLSPYTSPYTSYPTSPPSSSSFSHTSYNTSICLASGTSIGRRQRNHLHARSLDIINHVVDHVADHIVRKTANSTPTFAITIAISTCICGRREAGVPHVAAVTPCEEEFDGNHGISVGAVKRLLQRTSACGGEHLRHLSELV